TNESGSSVGSVVIDDDLSGVLDHASFTGFDGDDGGNAVRDGNDLTWNVGTLEGGETRSVSYTVEIDGDASGVSIGNLVTGDGEVPPEDCPAPQVPQGPTPQAAGDDPCETTHNTPATWTLSKESDPASGSEVAPGDT